MLLTLLTLDCQNTCPPQYNNISCFNTNSNPFLLQKAAIYNEIEVLRQRIRDILNNETMGLDKVIEELERIVKNRFNDGMSALPAELKTLFEEYLLNILNSYSNEINILKNNMISKNNMLEKEQEDNIMSIYYSYESEPDPVIDAFVKDLSTGLYPTVSKIMSKIAVKQNELIRPLINATAMKLKLDLQRNTALLKDGISNVIDKNLSSLRPISNSINSGKLRDKIIENFSEWERQIIEAIESFNYKVCLLLQTNRLGNDQIICTTEE